MYKLLTSCFVILTVVACKTPAVELTESKSDLLVKNNWIIEKFTGTDNATINESKLNTSSKLLYLLEFQFRSNNQVKAIDRVTKQVFNGGVWELSSTEKNLNIDIPGIKDDFELIEITKTKLVLRPNEKVFPIVDGNTKVNMVFIPSI